MVPVVLPLPPASAEQMIAAASGCDERGGQLIERVI
jgi:hypothetical protein